MVEISCLLQHLMSPIELGPKHQVLSNCECKPIDILKLRQSINVNCKLECSILEAQFIQHVHNDLIEMEVGLANVECPIEVF